ncbi:uncharacterized protein A4U43_C01F6660 [Asparagus officinalis]|uniref:WAT1-related protein n=1 Tax=Asparagus officinalis TaxID=4686 RepID=A0A5P1FPW5_ASPOF|nr:uncharacterized protein A4U43_C01F6660 [Asparagus officinalis]
MDDDVSKRICGVPEKVQLHGAMLLLQFGYAGFHIVSRLALNMGISKVVFPVYRNIIALILLVPFAYFLEKIEKVRMNRRDGIAKMLGTALCVAGAMVITLYKGPTIFGPSTLHNTRINLQSEMPANNISDTSITSTTKNWTLGCVYLIGHCLSWSGWLVLQAPVLKKYPARLSVTSYTCFFGVLQFLVIAAFMERDFDAWAFHSASEVFTVVYAGFVASGIAFAVQIWCIDRGGPVFVAVYQASSNTCGCRHGSLPWENSST